MAGENAALGNIVYEQDYFSGSQCLVYFSNVLVDDICRIAWNVTQSRTPIYGYASQYFNAVTSGIVIVNGSFWIDFKEAAYIPLILGYIAGNTDLTPVTSAASAGGITISRENIERFFNRRDESGQEGQTGESTDQASEVEVQQLMLQLAALRDRNFENVAEDFEDIAWRGGAGGSTGRGALYSGNFAGGPLSEADRLNIRRADQFPAFDMLIAFGDTNTLAANHSVIRLMEVRIIGSEFEKIEPTGEPIAVRYDFFARNAV